MPFLSRNATAAAAPPGIPRADRFLKLEKAIPIRLARAGRAFRPVDAMLTGIRPGGEFLCEVRSGSSGLGLGQAVGLRLQGASGPTQPGTVSGLISGTFSILPCRMTMDFANALSARLVFEAGLSPGTVKSLGLPLRIFRSLEYRVVRTADEYDQVLRLRLAAYAAVGKVGPVALPGDMRMPADGDPDTRILCAFHGKRVVASIAIFLPQRDQPMRAESLYPGDRFPIPCPPKSRISDMNSLCTDPGYRHGDLLQCLFDKIGRIFLASGRDWIISVADETVLPLYARQGFEILGHPCRYFGRPHKLIRLQRPTGTLGTGMGYLHWLQTYGPMLRGIPRGEMCPMSAWAWRLQRLKLAGLTYALRLATARREARLRKNLVEARAAHGGLDG